jgi:hypothetical protein
MSLLIKYPIAKFKAIFKIGTPQIKVKIGTQKKLALLW